MVNMRRAGGFTLIELLVVMAIIATLLSIAAPRYFDSVARAKEAALREDLALMRDALDKHYADHGKYPQTLEDLATKRYLRAVPVDPITGRADTWIIVPPSEPDKGGVYDVKSGAIELSRAGTPYSDW